MVIQIKQLGILTWNFHLWGPWFAFAWSHVCPLWGATRSKLGSTVRNSRGFGISTRRANKWTRGCSFNSGVSNSFLRLVMPFPEVQSTHYKSDCAFSAIQLPPWLSREPGCTSGNKGHGIKISITITNTGVVHLCVYMADGRLDKTSPDLCNFPSLQPMWRSRSL